jgi:hypothetical protein
MSAPFRIPFSSPGSVHSNFDNAFAVQVASGSTDAIVNKEGNVFITTAGVNATTLAVPTAGLPSAGGDDGRELTVIDTAGHAHTVTTPANGINGNKHVATFGGTTGQFGTFISYNGVWYLAASSGVTLT